MSKIAIKPIKLNDSVKFSIQDGKAMVSGPKGNLEFVIPQGIIAETKDSQIVISQVKKNDELTRPLFGLTRAILNNLVIGVTDGFEKKLELTGVGYRAQAAGDTLT